MQLLFGSYFGFDKTAVIGMVVLIVLLIVAGLSSSRPRAGRRRIVLTWTAISIIALCFLAGSGKISAEKKNDAGEEDSYFANSGSEKEPDAFLLYASDPEVNIDDYTEVVCSEVWTTSFLQTSSGGYYPAEYAFDGDIGTCWQDGEDGDGSGNEISVSLSEPAEIRCIVIYNGQAINDTCYQENGRVQQLEISSGENSATIDLHDENVPFAIMLENWGEIQDITFRINSTYAGSIYKNDTCISEIFFYR